ncbi:MAG: hypothetical protein IJ574_01005 [Bacilli bacterium]|nr:hypothetical protein [Bacilli bacterium]
MPKTVEKTEKIDVKKIKSELNEYIDKEIKRNFLEELEKSNKRLIKEKSRKVIFRDIVIILLVAIIVYLLYLLNNIDYFDKYFNKTNNQVETKESIKNENNSSDNTNTLEKDNKIKYLDLINTYNISEDSLYLSDFYNGNLSNTLKLYITINNLDLENYIEEDYNIIDELVFRKKYNELFDDEYINESFIYNNINIKYISKLSSYITDKVVENSTSNIVKELLDVKVDNDTITITAVEGLIKNNKLYNVLSNKEINNYKKDELSKYKDKLSVITYTFENNKLISIKG